MLVYHGSKSRFDVFDYSKMGLNGTSEGFGFYFTDNMGIAEGYGHKGYIMIAEFLAKKPLSSTKLTISNMQLRKLITKLHKQSQFLSNYGDIKYSGFKKVLDKAMESELEYSDNDVDLICAIANTSGSRGEVLKTVYDLLGYDSIQVKSEWGDQNLYIAITNDIIKVKEIIKTPFCD
jgi:alpha-galactosidase/6-phospho-beta-glucosidase family protein